MAEETEGKAPTVKQLEAAIMVLASSCYEKIEKGKRAEKVIIELRGRCGKMELSMKELMRENTTLKTKAVPVPECEICEGLGHLDGQGRACGKNKSVTGCPRCNPELDPKEVLDVAMSDGRKE